MAKTKKEHRVGIIPFSVRGETIAILFVTSQTRGRWILPKGRLKKNEIDEQAAMREAFEEAGIEGNVLTNFPMSCMIEKSTTDGTTDRVPVTFYPMLVTNKVDDFPEKDSRDRQWALLKDAKRVAYHDDYLALIDQFQTLSPRIKEAVKSYKA